MTPRSNFRQFLRSSRLGRWGLALALLLVFAAIVAPWISRQNPAAQDLPDRLMSPSAAHWFGTDELGRDIFSRTLYGARVSLTVGISVVIGAGLVGLAIGCLAGYFGGAFDRFVNIILINTFLSFPGVLLAIALAASLGPGLRNVIIALVIAGWAGYARLASFESEGDGFHRRSAFAGCFRRAHLVAASFAEHHPARVNPSHHRHGQRHSRRIHAKFSRPRGTRANAQLGRDAQRRPQSSFRRAAHDRFPRARNHGRRALIQFTRRRSPRLAGPENALIPNHARPRAMKTRDSLRTANAEAPVLNVDYGLAAQTASAKLFEHLARVVQFND